MRVKLRNDLSAEVFSKQLLDIGNGKMESHENTQLIKLLEHFCNVVDLTNALIENVFPNIRDN